MEIFDQEYAIKHVKDIQSVGMNKVNLVSFTPVPRPSPEAMRNHRITLVFYGRVSLKREGKRSTHTHTHTHTHELGDTYHKTI